MPPADRQKVNIRFFDLCKKLATIKYNLSPHLQTIEISLIRPNLDIIESLNHLQREPSWWVSWALPLCWGSRRSSTWAWWWTTWQPRTRTTRTPTGSPAPCTGCLAPENIHTHMNKEEFPLLKLTTRHSWNGDEDKRKGNKNLGCFWLILLLQFLVRKRRQK